MNLSFFTKSKKLPTDLEILECIYHEYYKDFTSFTQGSRAAKIYVPVDFDRIGKCLGVDGDIPFGRLYYFLNSKFRIELSNGNTTQLFETSVGSDINKSKNAVQFVLLASVLSEMKIEHKKHITNITISWMSLIISLAALFISLFKSSN